MVLSLLVFLFPRGSFNDKVSTLSNLGFLLYQMGFLHISRFLTFDEKQLFSMVNYAFIVETLTFKDVFQCEACYCQFDGFEWVIPTA